MGHEYPRPLNRSQDGAIMKYFAEYTGLDETYQYADVRAKSLPMYEKVCIVRFNIYPILNTSKSVQLVSYVDSHIRPLDIDFNKYVKLPLETASRSKKIQDCGQQTIESKFEILITTSQLWYDLLLAIGFQPGEELPFSTKDFMLPNKDPMSTARSDVVGQSSQLLTTIGTKIQDLEAKRLAKLKEAEEKDAKRAEKALQKVQEERLRKEKEQEAVLERERAKLKEQNAQRVSDRTKAAQEEEEEAEARQRRFEEYQAFIEQLTTSSTVASEDNLAKLSEFSEDPLFSSLLTSNTDTHGSNSIADAINRIRQITTINQLTSTQSRPGPSESEHVRPSKKKSSGKSKAISSVDDAIDLTYSDDDYDMGERLVMQEQLDKIPWPSYGLTSDIVAPALHAIKKMEVEDQVLFSDDVNVKEILRLGVRALKEKQGARGEASFASDGSSSKRSHSDVSATTRKMRKVQVIDKDTFIAGCANKKDKGKDKETQKPRPRPRPHRRRSTPVFTSDEEHRDEIIEDD